MTAVNRWSEVAKEIDIPLKVIDAIGKNLRVNSFL